MWRDVTDRLRALPERFPKATAILGALWSRVRDEPLIGIALSILLHVALIVLIVYMGGPALQPSVKRGEPLFVELPEIKDQAPRGNPAARTPGPPALPAPEPLRPPAPVAQPTPPARPTPPAPRVAEARPKAPEPPRVASTRPSEPVRDRPAPAEKPAPRPSEPPAPDAKNALPTPTEEARAAPAAPAAPASEPARPASPGGPQVASLPPSSREPVFDLKSLGRGGGAGGRGEGRGGIEGEPIPLDSRDPKYNDYLDRIRRMIKDKWGYPCVQNTGTRQCEYKTAQLVIEFGIAKDGKVPFVNVLRTSGYPIYDDYAVTAIKLASPFPPVPDALSKKGIPIMATFNYIVDTSLVNLLR
jgi:TonB family protein